MPLETYVVVSAATGDRLGEDRWEGANTHALTGLKASCGQVSFQWQPCRSRATDLEGGAKARRRLRCHGHIRCAQTRILVVDVSTNIDYYYWLYSESPTPPAADPDFLVG
jgi:hypothetical protein